MISSVGTEASPLLLSQDISRLPGSKESGDLMNACDTHLKLWWL